MNKYQLSNKELPASFRIDRARESDFSEFMQVYEKSFRDAYETKEVPISQLHHSHFIKSNISEQIHNAFFGVNSISDFAYVNDRVIGGISTTWIPKMQAVELHGLYIDPAYQKLGVGTQLLIRQLRINSSRRIYLDVAKSFKFQQIMYENYGFKKQIIGGNKSFSWPSWSSEYKIKTIRMWKK